VSPDASELRESSLFSDASLATVGAIAGTVISGVASIVIARELGVTSRGRWAVISSLAVIVSTIASAGLPAAVAYGGARLRGTERVRLVQAAVVGAAVLACLAGIVYLGAAVIVRPPAPTAAVIVGLAIPAATVAYAVVHALTLTLASMRWYATAQIATAVVTLIAVLVLAVTTGVNVLVVVIVSASAQFVGVWTCMIALDRRHALGHGLLVRGRAAVVGVLRPHLAYALITFATLSLSQVVQRIDVLLVNGYRGPRDAGLYAVAGQLASLMLVVPAALGFVMFRRGARDSEEHFADAIRVVSFTVAFGVAASLLALLLAGWAIPLVFGSAYRAAVQPFRWLLPGVIAFSAQSVLSSYLAGRGRPRVVLVAWLLGAVFGIGADLFVIPADGIVGAAVVSSLSYLLVTCLHVNVMRGVRPEIAHRAD
jgi:O-antigen/teichoic acid export membrane protein